MWEALHAWDRELFLSLNGDGGAICDQVMWYASRVWVWIPLYAVILYLVYRKVGLRNLFIYLVLAAIAVAASDQICNFFKHYTPRFRPTHTDEIAQLVHTVHGYRGGNYGTVSAHAATCFTIALSSAMILRNRWYTISIVVWALFVAYSRLYLGVHYPLDLTFGALVGVIMSVVVFRLYRLGVARFSSRN